MLSRGEVVILIDSSWSSWCCVFLDATPLVFLCVTCVSSVLVVAWCSSWLFSLAVFEAPSLYRAHVLSRRDRGTIVLSVFGGSVQLRRVRCSWKCGSISPVLVGFTWWRGAVHEHYSSTVSTNIIKRT